ncbi:hypothetical protein G7Y89_g11104 [Cudoniella acicularis]|uniref:Uncharacterized protein n=1 Tax=Cudoniella acicularis TaxID=354080 RepID=A0A8H4RE57_9HELO|nr:hypothetical protein G7Y89_g11104 [Cudoniella acicularis]
MMQRLLHLATEISDGIPSSYHNKLEERLAVAWGERRKRNRQPSRAETEKSTRENRARDFYLRVQDMDCLLFLPFVLAYSPRACADIKITEIAGLKNYRRDKVHVDTSGKTKGLIESIAITRGFAKNITYLAFIKKIFPEGSNELEESVEAIDLTTQQNSVVSPVIPTSCANLLPLNETQSGPTTITEIPLNDLVQQRKVLGHALLQGIADVFNEYICDVVGGDIFQSNGTTYVKAAITMTFPKWAILDCVMSLVIHESKVGDLAKALFNVQVVSEGNVRCLLLPGGVRATPNTDLTLKGVPDETIIRVFGFEGEFKLHKGYQ